MVTCDEIFAKIEARLAAHDKSKQKNFNNYKFIITTDDGKVIKTWLLQLKDAVKVVIGDGDADCTMTMSEGTMCDIGTGKLTFEEGIAQGKVKVDGDKDVAVLLQVAVTSL